MRGRTSLAGAVVAMLTLAACGTTSPLLRQEELDLRGGGQLTQDANGDVPAATGGGTSAVSTAGPAGAPATGAPGAAAAVTGPAATGTTATSGPATGATTSGHATSTKPLPAGVSHSNAGAGATASASASATKAAAALPASGRGYDAKSIYIGIPTQNDAETATSALGLSNLDYGNADDQVNAVLADINSHGGVLGRKLVPIFHDVSSASMLASATSAAQSACTDLTEDHAVVAVVNEVAGIDNDTFQSCLAQHGAIEITGGFVPDDATHDRSLAPYLYQLVAASFDDLDAILTSRLQAEGYFAGWNTTTGAAASGKAAVGLLYGNGSLPTRIGQQLKAYLTGQGITVAATYAYDASSESSTISSLGNAVLPFREAGVTHVIALDTGIEFFMKAADQQAYRPRYGLTSYNVPGTLLQEDAPASQLAGSLGIGWIPVSDVDSADQPAGQTGAANCKNVMTAGGAQLPSQAADLTAWSFCDGLYLLADAIKTSGGLSASAIRSGIANSNLQSALTLRTGNPAARSYLPAGVRDLGFTSSCSCFRYLSGTTTPF